MELRNLDLAFCGSQIHTEFENKTYLSPLTLIQCGNVMLSGITIERSGGIGLMIVNRPGSEVNIESAIFNENRLHSGFSNRSESDSPEVYGGGGV